MNIQVMQKSGNFLTIICSSSGEQVFRYGHCLCEMSDFGKEVKKCVFHDKCTCSWWTQECQDESVQHVTLVSANPIQFLLFARNADDYDRKAEFLLVQTSVSHNDRKRLFFFMSLFWITWRWNKNSSRICTDKRVPSVLRCTSGQYVPVVTLRFEANRLSCSSNKFCNSGAL